MNKYIYRQILSKISGSWPWLLGGQGGKFGAIVDEVPAGADVEDYSGKWVAPGLVDTHIHGFMNHDVMDNDAEGIKAMSEGLCLAVSHHSYQQP